MTNVFDYDVGGYAGRLKAGHQGRPTTEVDQTALKEMTPPIVWKSKT